MSLLHLKTNPCQDLVRVTHQLLCRYNVILDKYLLNNYNQLSHDIYYIEICLRLILINYSLVTEYYSPISYKQNQKYNGLRPL